MYWLLLIIISCVIINNQAYRDYYWRDYNGTIPRDAFVSQLGNTREYIGRGAFLRGYFVGSLEPGKIIVYSASSMEDGKKFSTKNVQILCVGSDDELEWVDKMKVVDARNLTRVVYSGYENNPAFSMNYVARDAMNRIGKVVENRGIYFFYNRITDREGAPDDFDVLVYKINSGDNK